VNGQGDVLAGLADRTVAGLGDAAAAQVQPQDRHLGAVLAGLGAAGGLVPQLGQASRPPGAAGSLLLTWPVVIGAAVRGSGSRAGR
jgi:hypothetical protein